MSVNSKILESYEITRDGEDGKSGLAVIFAFENFAIEKEKRHGTDKEIDNLKSLFTKMNLRVHVLQDLKFEQMKHALKVITKPGYKKPKHVDERFWHARLTEKDSVSFIAVTSHGDSECFQVLDGTMKDRDLEEYFYSDVCPILKGYPKLFLYNKCRDELGVERYEIANVALHCDSEIIVTDSLGAHCDKDMMAIYTCAEGIRSLRSPSRGSLVLAELPKLYEQHGKGQDILDFIRTLNYILLPMIAEKMKGIAGFPCNTTQVVIVERDTTCKRVCFLFPDEIHAPSSSQQNPSKSTTSVPAISYVATSPDTPTNNPSHVSASPANSYECYSHSPYDSPTNDPYYGSASPASSNEHYSQSPHDTPTNDSYYGSTSPASSNEHYSQSPHDTPTNDSYYGSTSPASSYYEHFSQSPHDTPTNDSYYGSTSPASSNEHYSQSPHDTPTNDSYYGSTSPASSYYEHFSQSPHDTPTNHSYYGSASPASSNEHYSQSPHDTPTNDSYYGSTSPASSYYEHFSQSPHDTPTNHSYYGSSASPASSYEHYSPCDTPTNDPSYDSASPVSSYDQDSQSS